MDETERSKIYIQMPVRIVVNSTNIFDYNYIIRKTLQNIKKREPLYNGSFMLSNRFSTL